MTGRLRAYVPLGLIAALALTGCSGTTDEASPTLPPVRASHTAASSASATTSAPPAQVVRAGPPPKTPFTKEGAELFVRDYYATASAALLTTQTDELSLYERRDCECLGWVEWLNGLHAKGRHFKGRGFRVSRVRTVTLAGNSAVVRITWSMSHMPLLDRQGRRVDRSTLVHRQTDMLVVYYAGGGWGVGRVFAGRPS